MPPRKRKALPIERPPTRRQPPRGQGSNDKLSITTISVPALPTTKRRKPNSGPRFPQPTLTISPSTGAVNVHEVFLFEKLPAELWVKIYELCLKHQIVTATGPIVGIFTGVRWETPVLLQAFRTNRQLYTEALKVYYRINEFTLHENNFRSFRRIPVMSIKTTQKMTFDLPESVILNPAVGRGPYRCWMTKADRQYEYESFWAGKHCRFYDTTGLYTLRLVTDSALPRPIYRPRETYALIKKSIQNKHHLERLSLLLGALSICEPELSKSWLQDITLSHSRYLAESWEKTLEWQAMRDEISRLLSVDGKNETLKKDGGPKAVFALPDHWWSMSFWTWSRDDGRSLSCAV